jgi:thiol:disulfide interchange protein
VYAKALDAVAASVEAELASVDPARIETFAQGVERLGRLTPAGHMERVGETLKAEGVEAAEMAKWMQANPAAVDELAVAMEARLAGLQPKLRAVLERVAELAPPDRKAAIEQQLATLPAPPALAWTEVTDAGQLRTAAARAGQTRGVVVDFTAAWCLPCQELERGPLADPQVVAVLADFERLRIDVTDPTPELESLQDRLGATTLPNLLVFDSGEALTQALTGAGEPATRITQLVSATQLRDALRTARGG